MTRLYWAKPFRGLLAVLLSLVPGVSSADLIMTVEADRGGQVSTAFGVFQAQSIYGWATSQASLVDVGDSLCGSMACGTVASAPRSVGYIDSTGHTRTFAVAEGHSNYALVEAGLRDTLVPVAGSVTFDIEIDVDLFATSGIGDAAFAFDLFAVGGATEGGGEARTGLFSFWAQRELDGSSVSSMASWSASTVNGGNLQAGEPGFFETSVTIPWPLFLGPLDFGLSVRSSVLCQFGVSCHTLVDSLNSACLRVTGATSASGYGFNCDLEATTTGGTTTGGTTTGGATTSTGTVPEPSVGALVLVAGAVATRGTGRWRGRRARLGR